MPRSARSSSTSRYDREKRRYHPTASRITSGSNWRHLNRPEIEQTSDIRPAYHLPTRKLQHFLLTHPRGDAGVPSPMLSATGASFALNVESGSGFSSYQLTIGRFTAFR